MQRMNCGEPEWSVDRKESGMNAEEKEKNDKREAFVKYRDEIRKARQAVTENGAGYEVIVQSVERLGAYLWNPKKKKGFGDLGKYKEVLRDLFPTDFDRVYERVRNGRNSGVHQGAEARPLIQNAVELAIMLEHALREVSGMNKAREVMASPVVRTYMWEPVAQARQKMLAESYSALPLWQKENEECEGGWSVITADAIVKWLQQTPSKLTCRKEREKIRKEREKMQLAEAIGEGLKATKACEIGPEEEIKLPDGGWCGGVLLVTNGEQHDLIGIVTAFDLL